VEVWSKFETYGGIIAQLLSGLYFLWAATSARTRMLWGDELYTLYVASLHDWGQVNRLLAAGGEFHPPFFYMLESVCLALFGTTELALRLPAIAGFWLMTACLFLYLRARASVAASLIGACFPLLAASSYFATEARGYAMVLGFGSLALLSWDRSGEPRRRGLALSVFVLSLAAAAASSYYGVLLVVPFAIAQGIRWRRTRIFEAASWCSLGGAILPMILSGDLVRIGAKAVDPWPAPPWTVAVGFYADLLQPAVIPLACFAAIAAGRWLIRPPSEPQAVQSKPAREDVALAIGFLAFSFWVIVAARLATHAFALRYAIPSVIGASILVGFAAARASRFEQVVLLIVFATYVIGGTGLRTIEHSRRERAQWDAGIRWLAARQNTSTLVVDGAGTFLKLSHYSPPQIRSRIMMLADPAKARQYGVDDSSDHTLRLLNPWLHLPVAEYDAFTRSHEEFLVLSDHWPNWTDWQWLTRALVDDGWNVTLSDQHGPWLLYRVTRPRHG
jgi:hypothetical protein